MIVELLQDVIVSLVVAIAALAMVLRVVVRRMDRNHNHSQNPGLHDMMVAHMAHSEATHTQILDALRRIEGKLP